MRLFILGTLLSMILWLVNIEAMMIINGTINNEITWLQQMKMWRQQIKDCLKQKDTSSWNCLKISSLQVFATILNTDVITLYDGVRLVRIMPIIKSTQITPTNPTLVTSFFKAWQNEKKNLQELDWFHESSLILARTFNTHILEINFEQLTKTIMRNIDERPSRNKETGRHRRQRYNMMMTMMFGVTALGAVLVPMGFQLLSIVSGKALLLAKMALLLASINGLKRVANSGIHYGLYHMPGEHVGGYYDRGDIHHPRTVLTSNSEPSLSLDLSK